jgi:DeoR/GlpR family transcriptional regulator of sugar metabolism
LEKLEIAKLAVTRIREDETIFLDASSTALTMAGFLPHYSLTVVTNALNVITALAERKDLDLVCTGGVYDPVSRSFIGLTAEKALARYNIHRMFFSGNGLQLERGISESNSRQAAFKERVIQAAEDVVFLADHSKLGQKASYFFGKVSDLGCLVTDAAADRDILDSLEELGVEVMKPETE